jgi:hypothetical protein
MSYRKSRGSNSKMRDVADAGRTLNTRFCTNCLHNVQKARFEKGYITQEVQNIVAQKQRVERHRGAFARGLDGRLKGPVQREPEGGSLVDSIRS